MPLTPQADPNLPRPLPFMTDSDLSEPQALALLRQHCGVLRGRLVFDASREHGAHVTQTWMALLCLHVSEDDLRDGLGYELRIAMDVVNALCACRGFAPHRNQRFWRDAVATLWIDYSSNQYDPRRKARSYYLFQPPTHYMLPFDRAAFACFSVDFQETSPDHRFEITLAELWRQVAWSIDATSPPPQELLDQRDRALTQLQRHAVGHQRTLQIELKLPSNIYCSNVWRDRLPEPSRWNWQPLQLALQSLGVDATGTQPTRSRRPQVEEVHTATQHVVTVAVHASKDTNKRFALHTTNLRHVQQLMTCHAEIRCLTLDTVLMDDATNPMDQIVWLGELLHTLLIDRQSLKLLRMYGDRCHERVCAAVCSLLPIATCLEELDLFESGDPEDSSMWRWLVYVLSHPLRHQRSHPTAAPTNFKLSVCASLRGATRAIEAAREMALTTTPLVEDVRNAMQLAVARAGRVNSSTSTRDNSDGDRSTCHWFASGTAVARVVTPHAELFTHPTFQQRVPKLLVYDTTVEILAVVASMNAVAVVARGLGICWMRMATITVERTPIVLSVNHSLGITRLSLYDPRWDAVESLVQNLDGGVIVSLTLTCASASETTSGDSLECVLKHCHNLEHLSLYYCCSLSLSALVERYASRSRPCRVKSLAITLAEDDIAHKPWDSKLLLAMLADPSHPGARVLRHLSVTVSPQNLAFVRGIARALAVNDTLETVFVNAFHPAERSPQRHARVRDLLSPFQDQVLNDARSACVGLLSVIRHYSATTPLGSVDALVVSAIMSFVGTTLIRTVRWLCDPNTCFPSLI